MESSSAAHKRVYAYMNVCINLCVYTNLHSCKSAKQNKKYPNYYYSGVLSAKSVKGVTDIFFSNTSFNFHCIAIIYIRMVDEIAVNNPIENCRHILFRIISCRSYTSQTQKALLRLKAEDCADFLKSFPLNL